MRTGDLEYGMKFTGAKGEVFEIADLPRYRKHGQVLIHFTETDNYQMEASMRIPDKVIDMGKPFLYGVGYISSSKDHPAQKEAVGEPYSVWNNMIERCYSGKYKNYSDVEVCEQWKDYTKFKSWVKTTQRGNRFGWAIDKDLMNGEQRIYSPETCVFLPAEINFMLSNKRHLIELDFSRSYPFKVYKLRLLVEKHKYNLQPKVYNYLDEIISKYEQEYKLKIGCTLQQKYSETIKATKVDLDEKECVCMINYQGNMFYFCSLGKIKKWLTKIEKELIGDTKITTIKQ